MKINEEIIDEFWNDQIKSKFEKQISTYVANILNKAQDEMYINMTGGGSILIPELLTSGGASKFLVGINIPYAEKEFIKISTEKPVSREAARQLAINAWEKTNGGIGIGITAALATEKQRTGRINQAFITLFSRDKIVFIHMVFQYGHRKMQETILARVVTAMISDHLNNDETEFQEDIGFFTLKKEISYEK